MDLLLEAILWFLGELLWQILAELVVEGIFLFLDEMILRRRALPKTWARVQLVAAAFTGPVAGAISGLVVPHRAAASLTLRILSWILLPLAGGAALALVNGAFHRDDRPAARRLGWLCGILFGLGYLAGRRLVVGPVP